MTRKDRSKPDPKKRPKRNTTQPQSEETYTCPKCGASIPESRYVGHLNMHYGAGA